MIISHRFKFIFVQNRKVAGSSVQASLGRHCGPEDILTSNGKIPEQNSKGYWNILQDLRSGKKPPPLRRLLSDFLHRKRFEPHMAGSTIKARIPRHIWNKYHKFCIERNPWDKTLSYFFMKKHRPEFASVSFDQFLARESSLCSDFDNYTDRAGRLIVDQVLRYESLCEDLQEVCVRLGIPFEGNIAFKINAEQRTDRRPYSEVYTTEQRKVVERIYAREIDLFGFVF